MAMAFTMLIVTPVTAIVMDNHSFLDRWFVIRDGNRRTSRTA